MSIIMDYHITLSLFKHCLYSPKITDAKYKDVYLALVYKNNMDMLLCVVYNDARRTRRGSAAWYGRCERLLATDSLPEVAFGGMTSITIRNVVPHRGVSASESGTR